jgi:tRNA threonylcarbamoyladenosine biosynthesis protein TsaE
MRIEVRCPGEADTRAVGRRLASLLRSGDVVLLAGDLGVGKTVFASGIGEGLGVSDPVVSPSFILARRYDGLLPMIHADLYRVGSSGEVEDLDLESEAAGGVLIVEWGDVAENCFSSDHLVVQIASDADSGARVVTLMPRGSWCNRPLDEVIA